MPATDTIESPDAATGMAPSGIARLYLAVAVVLLLIGSAAYAAAAAKLVWPDFLAGEEYLAYGRLLPASLNAVVVGWLTLGLAGGAIWVIPRLGGQRPAPALTVGGLLAVAGGLGVGTAGILLGESAGGRLLELPWWSDAAVAVGLLAIAAAVTRAVRGSTEGLPTAAWYVVAGLWLQWAGFVTGAIPGLDGVPAALQGRFAATVIGGLGPAMLGIGIAYYLVGRSTGWSFHPRLGAIGFWSLFFSWLWMAPRELQYGPTPDWLETVPVLFGAGLIVAAFTIAADFAHALRGRWAVVSESRSVQLSVIGVGLVVITAIHLFIGSLRGASSVLHFTLWEGSVEVLALFGAATAFAFAAVHAASNRSWPRALGAVQIGALAAGLGAVLASRWIGGLQQGYTWVGSVSPDSAANVGEAFRSSVVPLEGLQVTQVVGLGLVVIAALFLLLGFLVTLGGAGLDEDVGVDGPRAPLRTILGGIAGVFVVVAVSVVVLPAADTGDPPSLLAEATRPHEEEPVGSLGRDLYVREGCWYCHTQQVRGIVTDVGLGPVSVVGDYANDDVDLLGLMRIGPDLAHAGSRQFAGDAAALTDYLADPRAVRPWSTMPAFDHLSADERAALAVYVAGLE